MLFTHIYHHSHSKFPTITSLTFPCSILYFSNFAPASSRESYMFRRRERRVLLISDSLASLTYFLPTTRTSNSIAWPPVAFFVLGHCARRYTCRHCVREKGRYHEYVRIPENDLPLLRYGILGQLSGVKSIRCSDMGYLR